MQHVVRKDNNFRRFSIHGIHNSNPTINSIAVAAAPAASESRASSGCHQAIGLNDNRPCFRSIYASDDTNFEIRCFTTQDSFFKDYYQSKTSLTPDSIRFITWFTNHNSSTVNLYGKSARHFSEPKSSSECWQQRPKSRIFCLHEEQSHIFRQRATQITSVNV